MNFIYFIFYIIIIYFFIDFVKKNIKKKKNEPPGPLSLPLIGNLHQLTLLPHRGLTRLADKYKGIYRIYFGDMYTVVVTDFDIIKQMWVNDFIKFADRPKPRSCKSWSNNFQNLGLSDLETWSKVHLIIVSSLTKTKIISKSATTIDEQTKSLLYYINEKCNETSSFGSNKKIIKTFSLNILMEILFSKKLTNNENQNDDATEFVKSVNSVFEYLGKGNLSDFISILRPLYYFSGKGFEREFKYLMDILENIYNEHLVNLDTHNPNDLFDQLIIETNGDKEFIKNVSLDLILAGSDTITCTIEYFILFMINNPVMQERLYKELLDTFGNNIKFISYNDTLKLQYFNACLKETIRIKPPAPLGLFRYSRQDSYVGKNNEYFIPKNTMIFQNIFGLYNSERFIKDCSLFLPDRWMNNKNEEKNENDQDFNDDLMEKENKDKYYQKLDKLFNPFSIGKRRCPGEQIAKVEISIFLCNLFYNFKISNPNENGIIDEKELFFITIRPKPFSMKFTKRK
ncbi:hypothetical protein DICPUDRAFT_29455 [Dictyostelium purpureum]|uniref:Cytochrome P450 family protein n=1 Tax=Dictyostelium purpureum TaxID=5786 RepID=F0ZDP0_DICPU|nr:uncharacterized protein DICPUDRAFT_29455 [Dictyostelium purpureum]EGC37950.1 hypothetical protein DICPUDRAFT_29455 [Dictyostelium purpureum]|eukprot:XP_003285521.1 hypothetical protein DICPUDRAFT_29455 [Dictyostelium purpureum]